MTKRWGSKNFGAFLDALHGDGTAQQELEGRMLVLLSQKSPWSLKDLAQALAVTELQLYDVAQRSMADGRVEIFAADLQQCVRLVEERASQGG